MKVTTASNCVGVEYFRPLVKSVDLQSFWCCATYSVVYFDFVVSVSKMKKIKLEDEGLLFQEEWKDMYFNACC